MQFRVEIPEDTLVMKRTDLKNALSELIGELHMDNPKDEIMTIKEAAEYLKVSIPTVRLMIANKEIPFFKKGQIIRLNRSAVKEWVRDNQK
jgi:excisionase family DNA binding protein